MSLEPKDASALSTAAGLCATCAHARLIRSDRGSEFTLCQLSFTDKRFPKYPRLPVLGCSGYEQGSDIAQNWDR